MNDTIPILSLVVAILAVFIGPLIASHSAKQQVKSSLAIANNQVIAPMRQAWINDLRNLLAELLSSTLYYYVAGYENRTDAEYSNLTLLEYRIALMLNSAEDDHKKLEISIRKLISLLQKGHPANEPFPDVHTEIKTLSRSILKQEWNRVRAGVNTL